MNTVKPVFKAVIPVAGLGTRMLPATKAIPKELLPIYDRPIIEHVVKEAIDCGIREIIFITRSGKEAIENHFDVNFELEHRLVKKGENKILQEIVKVVPDYIKISSIRQADALGLGHAILCAKHLVNNEPFAVLLPDVLVFDKKTRIINSSFAHLVNAWNASGIGQVMVEQVDNNKIEKYGIIDIGGDKISFFNSIPIISMVEKPSLQNSPSNLAALGRYILPPEIFESLENIRPGVGNEIQLTDALLSLKVKKGLNAIMTDANIYDCGNKLGYLKANLAYGMQDPITRESIIALFDNLINDDF